MAMRTVIAVDAMGGDHAPDMTIAGAALARVRHPGIFFKFFGDEARLQPLCDRLPDLRGNYEICHAPEVISSDAKPSQALRQGRQSSMRLMLNAVAAGEAACAVSAGNTGALMALAKFTLKTLPGIDRPAIATILPTQVGESVMLDLGANVECDAENLVQFALMGAIFCRTVLGISQPSIGLLNIGAEEMKGHDELRTAASILRKNMSAGKFYGFVEGNDIALGTTDVVVTDGFSGNIALKTAEGTAKLVGFFLKQSFKSSLMARLGYLLVKGALDKFKERTDPRRYNGAMLLGLQGVCVKSHGGTDHEGFANAISVTFDLVEHKFNDTIRAELARHYGTPMNANSAPAETDGEQKLLSDGTLS